MFGIDKIESPDNLTDFLANCIDAWHKSHPDLGCQEVLKALEKIRHEMTEAMLDADR